MLYRYIDLYTHTWTYTHRCTHACTHTHTQTKGGNGMHHCGQITWCTKKLYETLHYAQCIHTAKNSERDSDITYKLGKPLIKNQVNSGIGMWAIPWVVVRLKKPWAEPLASHCQLWGLCQGCEWLSTSTCMPSLPGLMVQVRAVKGSQKQTSLPPQISLWWIW